MYILSKEMNALCSLVEQMQGEIFAASPIGFQFQHTCVPVAMGPNSQVGPWQRVLPHKNPDPLEIGQFYHQNPAFQHHNFTSNSLFEF